MEAQEQKQLRAKQSSVVFNQHHQVHLVRHHGNEMLRHRQEPQMKRDPILSPPKSSHCLPLSSTEAREEEGGGAEEEGVGGRAAREDAEQITILQRGQALSLSPLRLRPLLIKPLQASASLSRSPQN